MHIEATPSGDFKIVSDMPLSIFDLERVSREIYFDHKKFVKDWPVLTEDAFDGDYWVYWFIAPEVDDSYLDHEELI